jgi:AAHS family 4-hydroxybenzoate transporter-like MFS transporter
MNIRTFAVLFTCTLIPLLIGGGLFPLLPLYATPFGATRTDIGIFYAVIYFASAASVIGTGWLAERFSRRTLFLAGAALGPATMVLLGHATAFWQVVALTSIAWMCGGITVTLLNVFTGTLAAPASRGRVFGLMFLVFPLGALAGGAAAGPLTAAYGYTVMFYALAAVWAIQPVVGLIGLRDPRITRPPMPAEVRAPAAPLGRPFALLLASVLLSIACTSIGRLGTSLAMQALGFSPDAVASTAIVAGLATIPLALGLGALSDRVGRRLMLALATLVGAGGAAVLLVAGSAWQFQLAATLLLAGWCVGRAASSALASDLLAPEALGRGLPWLGAMDSSAGIVAFAATGYVMETLGAPLLFAAATALGLAATIALVGLPRTDRAGEPAQKGPIVIDRAGAVVPQASAEAGRRFSR